MKKIVALFLIASSINLVFAVNSVSQLTSYLSNNSKIKADFVQKAINHNKTSVSTGKLVISRPNRFIWSYNNEKSSQYIVSDGKKVYIYDQELQQVIVKPIAELINKSPAAILAGSDNLLKYYNAQTLKTTQQEYIWYQLTPKNTNENNGFNYINLAFDKTQQIRTMYFLDTFGNSVTITFSNISKDIENQNFNFKIPPGADVIAN